MHVRNRLTSWALGLLVAGAVVGLAGDAFAAGPRLFVTMDEPFVIDGEVFPAGELSLRPVRDFTPTTTLNEIWVGNRCLGILLASRSDDPHQEASRNAILFDRDENGQLVLRGFAYRVDGGQERHRYELLASRNVTATTSVDSDPVLIAGPASR